MESTRASIVIPCFNEAHRLEPERLAALAESGRVRLVLVDDGSTDGTAALLDGLALGVNLEVLHLPRNGGKGEAVRIGLLHAIEGGAAIVGYYDADLATPPEELLRMLAVLEARADLGFVMASRVMLLGRTIDRSPVRHYLGRVFATFASLILHLPVYDTQCGAKVIRVGAGLEAALREPFISSWAFDVELIGRLLAGGPATDAVVKSFFQEVPLHQWRDVKGSKITFPAMMLALGDLAKIAVDLRTRRRRIRVT